MAHKWNRVVRLCRLITNPVLRNEPIFCKEPIVTVKLNQQVPKLLCILGHRPYSNSALLDSNQGFVPLDKRGQTSRGAGHRGSLWSETNDEDDDYFEENEEEQEALRKRHRQDATDSHSVAGGMSFADLDLDPRLLQRLDQLGYKTPFEIQLKTLCHTLKGCDVIGRAVTGSGKTLAFAIPIVQKLLSSQQEGGRRLPGPKAIVIAPTRELANQIYRSIQELHPSVRCVALYGGDSMVRQEHALRRGVDVICATPGRLNDHIDRGNVRVNAVEFLCLDEADELLTPNFKMQLEDILQSTPKTKQLMMFSATMEPEVRRLAQQYMKDPFYVDLTEGNRLSTVLSVEHLCMQSLPNRGFETVEAVLRQYQPERSIVFLKTKVLCNKVAQFLATVGLQAQAIHSDLSQSRREKIMHQFRLGMLKVLCATDVAARGLDIPEVDLVVQAEPPANGLDYYVHRSGRTGRAGRKGRAVLIHTGSRNDKSAIYEIEKLVDLKHIPPPETAGGSLDTDFRPSRDSAFGQAEFGSRFQQRRPFSRHRDDFSPRSRNDYTTNYRSNSFNPKYGQRQRSYDDNQSYTRNSAFGEQKRNDGWWSEDTEGQRGKDFKRTQKKRSIFDDDE